MGNFLVSDFGEFSAEHDPGDIVVDCRQKVKRNNDEIERLEEEIDKIEKKVEVYLSQNKDPFELMKDKLVLVKKLEKLENVVDNLKDIVKNAEDMMETSDPSKQRKLYKEITKKKEKLGEDVFGDEETNDLIPNPVETRDINDIRQEQEDIEKMFTEN